jgi:hypothetical protein
MSGLTGISTGGADMFANRTSTVDTMNVAIRAPRGLLWWEKVLAQF